MWVERGGQLWETFHRRLCGIWMLHLVWPMKEKEKPMLTLIFRILFTPGEAFGDSSPWLSSLGHCWPPVVAKQRAGIVGTGHIQFTKGWLANLYLKMTVNTSHISPFENIPPQKTSQSRMHTWPMLTIPRLLNLGEKIPHRLCLWLRQCQLSTWSTSRSFSLLFACSRIAYNIQLKVWGRKLRCFILRWILLRARDKLGFPYTLGSSLFFQQQQ